VAIWHKERESDTRERKDETKSVTRKDENKKTHGKTPGKSFRKKGPVRKNRTWNIKAKHHADRGGTGSADVTQRKKWQTG